jgi:hypothetical protein
MDWYGWEMKAKVSKSAAKCGNKHGSPPQGFPDAIAAIFPKIEVQLCIIHQIRNSIKYVASKNQKAFPGDLTCINRRIRCKTGTSRCSS